MGCWRKRLHWMNNYNANMEKCKYFIHHPHCLTQVSKCLLIETQATLICPISACDTSILNSCKLKYSYTALISTKIKFYGDTNFVGYPNPLPHFRANQCTVMHRWLFSLNHFVSHLGRMGAFAVRFGL